MRVFERTIDGRRYRIAAQSVWDSEAGQPVSRQVVLGPADPPPTVDLRSARTVGTKRVGDVGALVWVADQLDLVRRIDQACGAVGSKRGPSVGEMVLAVAIQRACRPGGKCDLADFLSNSIPRVSCLPASRFTGQAFYRLAARVSESAIEKAQLALAKAAVERFGLSTSVLAFDSTNFDTYIATTTESTLPQRGKAKSKRSNLRVVGLGVLVSETAHVPLLHRTYPGNRADQKVLSSCLRGLAALHELLGTPPAQTTKERTVVRDGGFWSPQLELDLEGAGYGSIISLPRSHGAAREALAFAAQPRKMRRLKGSLSPTRAARLRTRVGELDRTLVVVESKALLEGEVRGVATALEKAKQRLRQLQQRAANGRITRDKLNGEIKKVLAKEHLAEFVVVQVDGDDKAGLSLTWRIDRQARRHLERHILGRRVLCTDRHLWSTERIVAAFRGQWKVEEVFRRAKGGGTVPWGPSFQWTDPSLRLHTFATVVGLMLVALARQVLCPDLPVNLMMERLRAIQATQVRIRTGRRGRPPTILIPPQLDELQQRAIGVFALEQWFPGLSSTM